LRAQLKVSMQLGSYLFSKELFFIKELQIRLRRVKNSICTVACDTALLAMSLMPTTTFDVREHILTFKKENFEKVSHFHQRRNPQPTYS